MPDLDSHGKAWQRQVSMLDSEGVSAENFCEDAFIRNTTVTCESLLCKAFAGTAVAYCKDLFCISIAQEGKNTLFAR